MPVDNPSMPATSPCQTLLFAPRSLIAEHRLPVSEVPRGKQSIGNCYRERMAGVIGHPRPFCYQPHAPNWDCWSQSPS